MMTFLSVTVCDISIGERQGKQGGVRVAGHFLAVKSRQVA